LFRKTIIISIVLLMLFSSYAHATSDETLLARLIYAEARGESEAGKLLVAQCVMDRLRDGTWGDTLQEVITYPEQFAVSNTYNDECLDIARRVLGGERHNSNYNILFFRVTTSVKDWVGDSGELYAPYIGHEGEHAFYGWEVVPVYIIEQERKRVYSYTGNERLQIATLEDSGMIELYIDKEVVGVFATTEQAMREMQNIINSESEVYVVAQ